MRARLALLLFLAGCAGVEGDVRRAEMKEFFLDLVRGKDRGVGYYASTIKQSTTEVVGGRYQYTPPAHISHYLVDRSLRGLGGTKIRSSDDLAVATDWLLHALAFDPTASIRSTVCEQLGRILLRLPLTGEPPTPTDPRADRQINTIAQDLFRYGQDARKGKKVTNAEVVERMVALAKQTPPTQQSAQQMARAFAAYPVVGSTSAKIRAQSEKLVPGVVRAAILVSLREVACGDPRQPHREPDPAPIVRAAAAEVLARVQSTIALEAAAQRLQDPIDPAERDADVRRTLITYLGEVGGPRAFATCVVRLDDVEPGVRYRAQQALQHMTGARVGPDAAAWRAWRDKHAEWQE
ncbi:MAG: HEAT repeat domain-containing protein [Planctomycetota bacterium]